jgi:Cof subfamily protein (haloacid dehalogenase superfamily)
MTTHNSTIRLIAIDVDGTLLNSQHEISTRTQKALQAAMNAGVQVILATGRPRRTVDHIVEQLQLTTPGVFMQGLHICNADGSLRHEIQMAAETAKQVAAYAHANQLTTMIYNYQSISTRQHNDLTKQLQSYHEPYPTELGDNIVNFADQQPIAKFIFIERTPERIAMLRSELSAMLGDSAEVFTSMPLFLEVLPPQTSKGAGLKWLLDDIGVLPEHVLAIGDGENDIEMLQLAGIGVAMGNGAARLKAVANAVVADNNHDGVAQAIEQFVLGATTP